MNSQSCEPFARTLRRRTVLAMLGAGLAPWARAQAQEGAVGPIRLVVPFSAGGGADLAARVLGQKLAQVLGQPVVIDNKPGASGNIGAEWVARAPADGRTLLFANDFLSTNAAFFKALHYDALRDLAPVGKVASTAVAIAVHPSLPVRNMHELLALARTRPLNYASPGLGSGPHLYATLLALQSGADLRDIPYKGSAPATADAVGGQVDAIISTLTPMVPYFSSGRLRPLAIMSARRSAQAPDVPTMAQAGVAMPPYAIWYGVLAPAATPASALLRLQQAVTLSTQDAAVQAKLQAAGYEAEPAEAQAFGAEIKTEIARWTAVVRDAKVIRE